MNRNKKKLIAAREACQSAKIGENISCPSCGTEFVKKSYQSVFCKSKKGTKCKDNFWNNVDSSKRNNRTRISPASAAYTARREFFKTRRRPHAWEVFGVWHDDDWHEHDGGSGGV